MINFSQDESTLNLVAQPVDQFGNLITNLDSASWAVENEALLAIQNQSGATAQFSHPDHTTSGQTRVFFRANGIEIVADVAVTVGAFFAGSIVKA